MQASVQKAELAAAKAGVNSIGGHTEGLNHLQPVLQEARLQLEAQRCTDALRKAMAGCKSLSDHSQLEAAIISARKSKCHDEDMLR